MQITKATVNLGADVRGIDLSRPLDAAQVQAIRAALLEHQVLFFREQKKLTVDEHVAFATNFGDLDLPYFRTKSSTRDEVLVLDQVEPKGEGADSWHADNTYMECPTMGSVLQAHLLPEIGGDTCFASMTAAYDALSPSLQRFLDGLTAVHSLEQMVNRTQHVVRTLRDAVEKWPPVVHPVVRVHPETGRKLLNVNKNWTVRIVGMSTDESDALLRLLYDHIRTPDFQVRLRWNLHDIAFWDNRVVQHYAVPDYKTRRMMQRVTIVGDRPVGVAGLVSAPLNKAA